jgi:hypothetical protein
VGFILSRDLRTLEVVNLKFSRDFYLTETLRVLFLKVTGECDEKLYTYIFIIDKFFDTTIGM